MLTLITGVPGHGKTLRAVELLATEVKKGRTIFANIDGLNIPGIQSAPDDWRDTPDGALIVYDEAQRLFPASGRALDKMPEHWRALETHRHTGHDLILITQHPSLIAAPIRRLVGRHEHVIRRMGMKRAEILSWDRVGEPNQSADQSRADRRSWAYPVDLFSAYQSSTHHSAAYQFRMPNKVRWVLVGIAAAGVAVAAMAGNVLDMASGTATQALLPTVVDNQPSAPDQAAQPPSGAAGRDIIATSISAPQTVSGCVWTARYCRCYDANYQPLMLSDADCLNTVERPLPIAMSGSGGSDFSTRSVTGEVAGASAGDL